MHIRNTIYKIQILFSLIILAVFFLFYSTYKASYKRELDIYVNKEIQFNKSRIIDSLKIVSNRYQDKRNLFLNIHNFSLEELKENPNLDLSKLKLKIKKQYKLDDIDVELYLIDKNYVIYNTTFPKDLGFNLSFVTEAKDFLDKSKIDEKVYLADNISEDPIDGKYKLYSYSKLKNDVYLELGFVDKKVFNSISNDLNNHKDLSLYIVITNKDEQYYYKIEKRNAKTSKEDYFNSFKKFLSNKEVNDVILNTMRNNKSTIIEKNHEVTIYVPLLEFEEFSILNFTSIIFLYFIFNWIKHNFTKPIELITASIKHEEEITYFKKLKSDSELTYIAQEYNNLYKKFKNEIRINKELIYIDSLTKVNNRKAYSQKIKEDISLKKRYNTSFCMIMINIDDFKKINDLYGHKIGDDVLIELTKSIELITRKNDFLYRIGGEEFIIILSNTVLENAKIVTEKIRETIANELNTIKNHQISVSIGLTEVKDEDTEDSIFKRVDTLMYKSKNNGKNKITI